MIIPLIVLFVINYGYLNNFTYFYCSYNKNKMAISSLVVVIITVAVLIRGGLCLIICGKVAVSLKDRPQGVVVAAPLKGRPGRILQVSSVPVWDRSVNARRQEERFRILSDEAGIECKFGSGGDCPWKYVASMWNIPYDISTIAKLQEYGIGPGMGDKRGVVVTVVVEEG